MVDKKIFKSKILAYLLIYSFFLMITSEAAPYEVNFDTSKDFKPVVRVKEEKEQIPAGQKDRFERLIEEGKKLFREEMNPEGAINKFKEAQALAITRAQKADAYFYLSLVYYTTVGGEAEQFVESIRKLIEVDYYRELDKRLCPPKYRELFQEIKKEYGVLKVQSKPAGADVYLNDSNVPVGKTPLTIGSKAGSVKIRVKKGKKEKKEILRVIAGKETTPPVIVLKGGSSFLLILGALVFAGGGAALLGGGAGGGGNGGGNGTPTTAIIQVSSSPQGATVYLDGNDTGKKTYCTLSDISPGYHTVKLVKEGYEDYTEHNILVATGGTSTVDANLTKNTITVNNPTSNTIWTKGEEVEIRWETSGSSSFLGNVNKRTGLNPLSHPGRNSLSSFRLKTLQHRNSLRNLLRTRRKLDNRDNMGSSGITEISSSKTMQGDLSKSSSSQDASKIFSSSGKKDNIIHQRAKNIGIIKRNKSFGRINLSVSQGISAQIFKPSGNTRALAITNVKIDLYKGSTLKKTIVSDTGNDGSYTWSQVDTSLADGSDYKVRISCLSDSSIYYESDSFQIGEKSIITVSDPTSSTVWSVGKSAYITWTSKGTIINVKIDLYRGSTLKKTIVSDTGNDGSYTWSQVDTSLADSSNYRVRISNTSDSSVYDESDIFKIEEKSITVTEPTSSTIWARGYSADITWISKTTTGTVKIDLYKESTLEKTIVSNTENDGSYTWTVDTSLGDSSNYKVRITSAGDSSVYDETGAFKIKASSIIVIEPLSGIVWSQGDSAYIYWTSKGAFSTVKIDLYKQSTLEKTIVSSTENDGSYTWTVDTSLADSPYYMVRISSTADSSVYDESDAFKIEEMSMTVTEPTSSTVWVKYTQANITWTSKGAISDVKIDLYKGSTLEKTIVSSTENDGSYTWSIADSSLEDGSDYKVRISSSTDSNFYDESAPFKIAKKSITITEPTSSTVWLKNYQANITWTTKGNLIYSVKIDLYKGSTLKKTIIPGMANDGSYTWRVDTSLEDGSDYRVRISDYNDSSIYDECDPFKIKTKYITVTEPTSSTIWAKGYSANITWTYKGAISNVKIDLYKGSIFEKTIIQTTENDGSYTWSQVEASLEDGSNYKVRISVDNDSSVYDESDAFKIKTSSITVTEPSSITVWVKWYQSNIFWTSKGAISNVKIDLYKGSIFERTIVSSTENDGSYIWSHVDTHLEPGSDFKVRISSADEPQVYDESDNFTISSGYEFVTKWGSYGTGNGQFRNPDDVAVDSSGYVYVVDNYNHRVQKFTAEGAFVTKWGSNGSEDGQFKSPGGVAVDSSGYVYVADTSNHRIQKFTGTGTFVTKWGSNLLPGNEDGQFNSPIRVAVGNSGYIYVVDLSNHRIQKFTAEGIFVTKWGSYGSGDGQFWDPFGVAVDSSGNVYVADGYNRIQKFQPISSSSQLSPRNNPGNSDYNLSINKNSNQKFNNKESPQNDRLKQQKKQINIKDRKNEKKL